MYHYLCFVLMFPIIIAGYFLHPGNHLLHAPALAGLVVVPGQLVEDEGDEVGGLAVGGLGGAADWPTGGRLSRLGLLVILMAISI